MVWTPPEHVRAAGLAARVTNTQGSVVQAGEAPQKPIPAATNAFRLWVLSHFAGFTSGGMARQASRRHTAGQRRDVHEEGRAVDFMVAAHGSPEGTALANWLVLHAEQLGLQIIIWDRTIWCAEGAPIWHPYTGSSAHTDHVHTELSVAASQQSAADMTARLNAAWSGSSSPPMPSSPPSSSSGGPTSLATKGAKALAIAAFLYGLSKVFGA